MDFVDVVDVLIQCLIEYQDVIQLIRYELPFNTGYDQVHSTLECSSDVL